MERGQVLTTRDPRDHRRTRRWIRGTGVEKAGLKKWARLSIGFTNDSYWERKLEGTGVFIFFFFSSCFQTFFQPVLLYMD